ncbi:DUF5837 family protein [Spirulina subsalsa FACHB-351]|uniref:DUF5837 family protein n=1 Tax=Spirulina subsalsa FACHB-351 TaxID=234711 RepID=A0ABT3L266_9CYAN|nr:DUF5837 family cyanobactin class RiPP [Spirulina subsalsa]MCW6035565.1 DUF5837 family protein [Spirulina subsalsa FACHB-351]
MDKKNITPNPQQPVDRVPSGQLPSALAELSEEAIGSLALPAEGPAGMCSCRCVCSYEGDDE